MSEATSNKLKLFGFNNLTKSLSFNLYDICHAATRQQQEAYLEYLDEVYNSRRLTRILTDVADIVGASILNIARQDYDPRGASVTMLIAEEPLTEAPALTDLPAPLPEAVVAHLDKSHITVHTYPERHPDEGISTFRADIDVSTCGQVSPLSALNYLIGSFQSDIVIMDYRVRGFTRDVRGRKHFIDHDIDSIRDYLSPETLERYEMVDVNIPRENMFHTRMLVREFELEDYLVGKDGQGYDRERRRDIGKRLRREMTEIFSARNI